MRWAVIRFPGSHCAGDVEHAIRLLDLGEVRTLTAQARTLQGADVVVLPGGFSHGDYLRPGAMAARSPVMAAVSTFVEQGGPVLGICNGFQILCEAQILPGALAVNRQRRFVCQDVHLRLERADLPFTRGYTAAQVMLWPIAHEQGRYVPGPVPLSELQAQGQIVLRYCDADGRLDERANPNGSTGAVAGITNRRGNVLGVMPHPERAVDPRLGPTDGVPLFTALAGRLVGASR